MDSVTELPWGSSKEPSGRPTIELQPYSDSPSQRAPVAPDGSQSNQNKTPCDAVTTSNPSLLQLPPQMRQWQHQEKSTSTRRHSNECDGMRRDRRTSRTMGTLTSTGHTRSSSCSSTSQPRSRLPSTFVNDPVAKKLLLRLKIIDIVAFVVIVGNCAVLAADHYPACKYEPNIHNLSSVGCNLFISVLCKYSEAIRGQLSFGKFCLRMHVHAGTGVPDLFTWFRFLLRPKQRRMATIEFIYNVHHCIQFCGGTCVTRNSNMSTCL